MRLFRASCTKEFAFVVPDEISHKTYEEALKYANDMDVEDVEEIVEDSDLDYDLRISTQYGLPEGDNRDCRDLMRFLPRARRIAKLLGELDYELESTFVKDLEQALRNTEEFEF